ncbi:phospho-2-dehydro-3-deoxyheptonate aldolase 1, chloroplastic-like [Coffea eugenioides]|uniref:Phospho-2-dehydro-3-deoxyheptonate aldolase n=1 Tax=Coffea arabica TaxID=13443 RepID=A0A6P6TGR8_COFAR|nr:phospho-2-dehydro-3-deoxyheptonate aldolase 1, chloroplastic-like [Coffea arabica]XP_027157735.1 phospho-2-dehydro-3-deoxyheptonate aldolase 1, chloroplastic-like [Coffea eugenioides]XP_027177639.1 phospho-2-dehydro-3-deoxyheptonate aldolase 1, chloroplastic-like [Coffea eugenioides]
METHWIGVLVAVLETLESFPTLVLASEIRALEERLANAAMGNAFLLQGGDCAESFKEFRADNIFDAFNILAQMSIVLMFGGQKPVIKVGRMAGQFAKPRSTTYEEKDELRLPIYKGDSINGYDFNRKSRTPE